MVQKMKRILLSAIIASGFTSAFCHAEYSYNYKLNCGAEYPHVDILDSDVINIAMIGKGDKELLAEHSTGLYHMVGGVQMQNGINVSVYAHAIDPKKFKGDKSPDMPVSAWDELSIIYTGDGINRQYNIINEKNTECKIVSYTDNSKNDK